MIDNYMAMNIVAYVLLYFYCKLKISKIHSCQQWDWVYQLLSDSEIFHVARWGTPTSLRSLRHCLNLRGKACGATPENGINWMDTGELIFRYEASSFESSHHRFQRHCRFSIWVHWTTKAMRCLLLRQKNFTADPRIVERWFCPETGHQNTDLFPNLLPGISWLILAADSFLDMFWKDLKGEINK